MHLKQRGQIREAKNIGTRQLEGSLLNTLGSCTHEYSDEMKTLSAASVINFTAHGVTPFAYEAGAPIVK